MSLRSMLSRIPKFTRKRDPEPEPPSPEPGRCTGHCCTMLVLPLDPQGLRDRIERLREALRRDPDSRRMDSYRTMLTDTIRIESMLTYRGHLTLEEAGEIRPDMLEALKKARKLRWRDNPAEGDASPRHHHRGAGVGLAPPPAGGDG